MGNPGSVTEPYGNCIIELKVKTARRATNLTSMKGITETSVDENDTHEVHHEDNDEEHEDHETDHDEGNRVFS